MTIIHNAGQLRFIHTGYGAVRRCVAPHSAATHRIRCEKKPLVTY